MLLLLKSVEKSKFLSSIFFILHHNDLVSYSAKFDGVSELKLVSFLRLKFMLLVRLHVSENHPELVTRIRLLFFRIFYCLFMEYPKVIIFKKASSNYFLVILFLKIAEDLLLNSHFFKVLVKVLCDDVFIFSF